MESEDTDREEAPDTIARADGQRREQVTIREDELAVLKNFATMLPMGGKNQIGTSDFRRAFIDRLEEQFYGDGPDYPDGDDGDDHDTHILDEAIETVYDRPETHGKPEDSFARIAEMWEAYLGVEVTAEDVANMMVLLKVARNAEGHYHEDNYVDIAGYAENGARLEDG